MPDHPLTFLHLSRISIIYGKSTNFIPKKRQAIWDEKRNLPPDTAEIFQKHANKNCQSFKPHRTKSRYQVKNIFLNSFNLAHVGSYIPTVISQ